MTELEQSIIWKQLKSQMGDKKTVTVKIQYPNYQFNVEVSNKQDLFQHITSPTFYIVDETI